MENPAPERKESETFKREDKAEPTPAEDRQYYVKLPTKVTVQEKKPQEDTKNGTPICREQVNDKTHILT